VPKQIPWNVSKAPERASHALPFVLPKIVVQSPGLLSVVLKGLSHKGQAPAPDRLLQGPDKDVVPGLVPSNASHYHLTDGLRPKLNEDFLLKLKGKMGTKGIIELRMVTIRIRKRGKIRSTKMLLQLEQELQTHHQRPRDM
jgi:hypothetical protein